MSAMSTRREFAASAAALAAMGMFRVHAADAAIDSPELAATKKWFKDAQFGMMAHWGLYTLLAPYGRIPVPGIDILRGLAAKRYT